MIEKGLVEKTNGKYAFVKVNKKDECSKCGMCLFPKNTDSIKFRSLNALGAKEGDEVLIKTSEKAKISGVFLAFGVPLLLIALSIIIGYFIIKSELSILLISIATVILWFLILPIIDKKFNKSKTFLTEIIEIIGE